MGGLGLPLFQKQKMYNKITEINERKRVFDAKSQKDLEEFKYYMVNKRWRDLCPFQSRWPYLSVVDMIKDDIVMSVLDQPNTITYKRYNFDGLNNVMKKKLS
jgi:hypothetical protein